MKTVTEENMVQELVTTVSYAGFKILSLQVCKSDNSSTKIEFKVEPNMAKPKSLAEPEGDE